MKWRPDTNTQETMKRRRRRRSGREGEHVFWFAEVFSTCSPAEELLLEVWDPSAAASATGFTTVSLGSGAAS